jgi:hypothetical protein
MSVIRGGTIRPATILAVAPHVARAMPWGTLLSGCLLGVAVSGTGHQLASPYASPSATLLTVRASFIPVAAGLAFLVRDPQRTLTSALPVRAWLTTAIRALLAVPVVAVASGAGMFLASSDIHRELGPAAAAAGNPVPLALAAEVAAWAAVALALAMVAARTRWADLGGAVAAPAALAVIGLLLWRVPGLAPSPGISSSGGQPDWGTADAAWLAAACLAAVVACLASRDPWRRLPLAAGPSRPQSR